MAEAEEENRGQKRCHHTPQMNGLSRILLHDKLMNVNFQEQISNEDDDDDDDDDEIELSLGLSLNGRFGVDPTRAKRLKRSSSITNFVFATGADDDSFNNGCSYLPIARTCSLPVEPEEECRKRKEIQCLRRLEAKRKRMEKLQNVNKVVKEENGNHGGNGNSLHLSQGSMGSQGSGCSGISDFGSQPIQGSGDSTEANNPTTVKSSECEQKQVATQPKTTNEKPPNAYGTAGREAKEMFKNFMQNMPCVSTKGNGPNGKKIEGFLYRYRKGEEVRIVCVCHGNFLTPAEFVKHAGGGHVENPLKHIVVSPSPVLG